jgi:hypothetical protein
MGQKNYHDAIRKKLESIKPEYHASDWGEMQASMAVQTPAATFWKLNGKNILLGDTANLLVTSLIFNAKQFYDDKLLLSDSENMITAIQPITKRNYL